MVVSMETIEHVPDWEAVLAEFRRILRPDGRLIASVPDRWVDATGRDPNPYHLHAFDWQKFADGLQRHFIIESRFQQTAPGGFKLQRAARSLQRVAMDSTIDSEWLIAVASVDPLAEGKARRDSFTHPAFQQAFAESGLPVVGFGDGYENPYLYRSMVQLGERLTDNNNLVAVAQRVITDSTPNSADVGGAIAVLGYRVLEERLAGQAPQILERIQSYIVDTEANREAPHIARWRLSLSFLAGRLAVLMGERDLALAWYEATSTLDCQLFSPILATKTVAAAFYAGLLHLVGFQDGKRATDDGSDDDRSKSGDIDRARVCFTRGLNAALAAARSPAAAIVGNLDAPVPFAMPEIAEVMDMGGQCAAALNYLPYWQENPGLFWQQVDVKRFGLATWAMDQIRVNHALTAELNQQVAINQRLKNELRASSMPTASMPMDRRLAGLNFN
jgi:SAM-dependent methyltransferase